VCRASGRRISRHVVHMHSASRGACSDRFLGAAVCWPCSLHNPLQRQERLSTGWFGVVCSFDGVLVEDTHHAHARAWLQVAEEMNLPRPLGQALNRIKGARDEVVSAGACWLSEGPTWWRKLRM